MHVMSIAAACMLAGALAACGEPTAPASDVLTVTDVPLRAALRLENRTNEPVFYFVAEQNTLALLDYVLCTDPSCPAVPAHAAASVSYGQISGYHRGARAVVVLHWRLRPHTGGFAADSIRALVVPL